MQFVFDYIKHQQFHMISRDEQQPPRFSYYIFKKKKKKKDGNYVLPRVVIF